MAVWTIRQSSAKHMRAIPDHDGFHSIHGLLSTLAEFIRQSAARLDGLRSVALQHLLQQERLTSAMAISLFAVRKVRDLCQQPVSR